MSFLYSLSIYVYVFLIRVASLFNVKARLWVSGRKNWRGQLAKHILPGDKTALFHCASLGEFEMARPLIEWMRKNRTEYKIVVSFFSPSGYEIRKNYDQADWVMYLPADTPKNARDFAKLMHPELVFFSKYEFWHHHIAALSKSGARLFSISAVFRKQHRFFKWYGSFFRKDLRAFEMIFVQDAVSSDLLKTISIPSVVAGDTRFDRVFDQKTKAKRFELIEKFIGGRKTIIAGSSWPEEEQRIAEVINKKQNKDVCWIIAPHDVSSSHLRKIEQMINIPLLRYSALTAENSTADVLLIDNVGMLMSLYAYAEIAIVGGGFSGKLHNILEPAAFACVVLFGPHHHRFLEAENLIRSGGAVTFDNDLESVLQKLHNDPHKIVAMRSASEQFVAKHTGACNMIINAVFV